jgi:hypothetical protein
MTAVDFPFLCLVGGAAGAAVVSCSVVLWRFWRRFDFAGFAGSGSGSGLGSRSAALRFLDGRVGGVGWDGVAALGGARSEVAAACRADARVFLADMSDLFYIIPDSIPNFPRLLQVAARWRVEGEPSVIWSCGVRLVERERERAEECGLGEQKKKWRGKIKMARVCT